MLVKPTLVLSISYLKAGNAGAAVVDAPKLWKNHKLCYLYYG